MKKILFSFVALVASMSMNAQVMKIMQGDKVVKMYAKVQADRAEFAEPQTLKVYKGNNVVATYSASEADRVIFGPLVKVTNITLNSITANLNIGGTANLTAIVAPENATLKGYVTWTSSNPNIAAVDANGKVTALNAGSAIITATINDGSNVTATCTVTVAPPVTAVSLAGTDPLKYGKTRTLTASVLPANASQEVTWASSDASTVRVNANGEIKALKPGSATITAYSKADPTKSKSITVTVPVVRPTYVSVGDYKYFSGEGPASLVDDGSDATSTKWCCFQQTDNYFQIVVSLDQAYKLLSIDCLNGGDTPTGYPERCWKTVKISGSSSANGSWTQLYNGNTNFSSSSTAYQRVNVNASTAYKYYKLEITAQDKNKEPDYSTYNFKQQMADMIFNLPPLQQ